MTKQSSVKSGMAKNLTPGYLLFLFRVFSRRTYFKGISLKRSPTNLKYNPFYQKKGGMLYPFNVTCMSKKKKGQVLGKKNYFFWP